MTEKIAKKIGEAYAFSEVLNNLKEANGAVITDLVSEEIATKISSATESHKTQLLEVISSGELAEIVTTKAAKTGAKITEMGEFYVGDDWDDAAEVLEWLSFFVGAAIIHWRLILGAAKKMEHAEFEKVSAEGVEFYEKVFEVLKTRAEKIGEDRSA